jgi:hypothetical protein
MTKRHWVVLTRCQVTVVLQTRPLAKLEALLRRPRAANLPSIWFRDRPGATATGLRSVGEVVRHAVRPHPWRCLSSRCSAGLAYTTEERAHSPPSCPASRGQAGERLWTARIAPRGGKPARHVPPGPPATRVRPGGTRRDVRGGRRFASAVPPEVADTASVSATTDRVAEAWHKLDIGVDAAVAMVFGPAGRAPPNGGNTRSRSPTWARYMARRRRSGTCGPQAEARPCRCGQRFPASRSRSRCPTARRRRPVATRIRCGASPRMAAAASG